MSLTPSDLIVRKDSAVVFLPSEDEWYKAAYCGGGGTSAGYWDYPTQSNTVPSYEAPPGTDLVNGSATYLGFNAPYVDPTYYTTEVGAYDAKPSVSAYGTLDQAGNVWEWNEVVIRVVNPAGNRGLRGGAFSNTEINLLASFRAGDGHPSRNYYDLGFRVARIPEPGTAVLGMVGLLCALWWRKVAG